MHPISVADLCEPTVGPVTFLGFATCIPCLIGPFSTWPCYVFLMRTLAYESFLPVFAAYKIPV